MAAEPVYVNLGERHCSECGLPSVVKVEDRPMCGHCFHLGVTVMQSRRIHSWSVVPSATPAEAPIEDAVRAALTEFEDLRGRIDALLASLAPQQDR